MEYASFHDVGVVHRIGAMLDFSDASDLPDKSGVSITQHTRVRLP